MRAYSTSCPTPRRKLVVRNKSAQNDTTLAAADGDPYALKSIATGLGLPLGEGKGQMGEDQQTRAMTARFPAIDALRGVLVLLVVLHHVHLRFVLNKFPVATLVPRHVGRVIFWSGYYAVVMFFVVSGFLITHHSLRRWRALPRLQLGAFYWLRFTRIYPCLLLLLAVLTMFHLTGLSGYVIDPQRATLTRAIVAALTFHFNWLEGTRGYLPGAWDVLWTLSVEETFYAFFPLTCLLLRRERWIACALLVLIGIGPVSRALTEGEPWDSYAYLSCLDCIAFGCLAALLHERTRGADWLARACLGVGALLIVSVIVLRETVASVGLTRAGLQVTALAFGTALVLWSIASLPADRPRRSSWLRVVGKASYEIYLTHMFVVFTTVALFRASQLALSWVFAFYAAATLASVALGMAVARFVGQPLAAALRGPRAQV
jgi:peptidoglycan/LPS O-acetylase OafA/YrhL